MISPSGPGATAKIAHDSPPVFPEPLCMPPSTFTTTKLTDSHLADGEGGGGQDRRCSVISINQTKSVMKFPIKNKKIYRDKLGDIRRPSDLWQGIKNNLILV